MSATIAGITVMIRTSRMVTQKLRLLHQHKVWDDQHLTCCLEANYSSFVQGIFSESMITQKFGGLHRSSPCCCTQCNRFP